MPVKFLEYDKAGIDDPGSVIERLLQGTDDVSHPLAVTDCFDLEDGDDELLEEALAAVNNEFELVFAKLAISNGPPTFSGTDKDKAFPVWAGTGCRVAYWQIGKRIVYLHIAHVGTIAPVELNLGIVTGPPKNWYAST